MLSDSCHSLPALTSSIALISPYLSHTPFSLLTVDGEAGPRTDHTDRVPGLADVLPMIVGRDIAYDQAPILLGYFCPPDRYVTVLLRPQYLRGRIAPDRTLELYAVALQHGRIVRFGHKVRFHCNREIRKEVEKSCKSCIDSAVVVGAKQRTG